MTLGRRQIYLSITKTRIMIILYNRHTSSSNSTWLNHQQAHLIAVPTGNLHVTFILHSKLLSRRFTRSLPGYHNLLSSTISLLRSTTLPLPLPPSQPPSSSPSPSPSPSPSEPTSTQYPSTMPSKTTIALLIIGFEILLPVLASLPDLIEDGLNPLRSIYEFIDREIMPGIGELAERELPARPEPVDVEEALRQGFWVTLDPDFGPVGLGAAL